MFREARSRRSAVKALKQDKTFDSVIQATRIEDEEGKRRGQYIQVGHDLSLSFCSTI